MNVIQFTAAVHDEVQKMVLPVCASPLQAVGLSAVLSLVDFRIAQLAAQYAEQADMLGVIARNTGEVNLAAVEHVLLNGTQWPQQIGPFKFDKSDAEKLMAAVKKQAEALKPPQMEQAQ